MRRFASVFKKSSQAQSSSTSSDHDRQQKTSAAPSSPKNAKSRYASATSPVSGAVFERVSSSGSRPALSAPSEGSSSASTSLQTPDDDQPSQVSSKKNLFGWLGSIKRAPSNTPDYSPKWKPELSVPVLKSPPARSRPAPRQPLDNSDTSESEDDEKEGNDEESNESSYTLYPSKHGLLTTEITTETIAHAKQFLQAFTSNSLVSPPASSPFYHPAGGVLFPRSCHSPFLPHPPNMRIKMLKSRLLPRLSKAGSDAEERVMAMTYGSRKIPSPIHSSPVFMSERDEKMPDHSRISSHSQGLLNWVARPCFEDRNVVWIPTTDTTDVKPQQVMGTGVGVADLEYSFWLESVGLLQPDSPVAQSTGDPVVSPPEEAVIHSDMTGADMHQKASSPQSKSMPYSTGPSPLRMGHAPSSTSSLRSKPSLPTVDTSLSVPRDSFSPPSSASPSTPSAPNQPVSILKRGVHFAQAYDKEDKNDQIPLSYTLRSKQKKAEKAKFLREEQERRNLEAEKLRVETERRKMEDERRRWEMERVAWEQEKRQREEEKKAKMYAEEVIKSRSRRESSRAGFVVGANENGRVSSRTSTTPPEMSQNISRAHNRESRRYSRPLYDHAQFPQNPVYGTEQASVSTFPIIATTNMQLYPNNSPSPGSSSSQPSSVAGQSPSFSRPASIHSTPMSSVEDVRGSGMSSSTQKRRSLASSTSNRPTNDRSTTYPLPAGSWTGSQQNVMYMPPVPPLPYGVGYGGMNMNMNMMNMPLLPPTPPFMVQQYPSARSRSRNSSSSSQSKPYVNHGSNHSSERIHHRTSSSSPSRVGHSRQSTGSNASSSYLPTTPNQRDYFHQHSTSSLSLTNNPQRQHHRRASQDDVPKSNHSRPLPSSLSSSHLATLPRGRQSQSNQSQQLPSPWTALPSSKGSPPVKMPQSRRHTAYAS